MVEKIKQRDDLRNTISTHLDDFENGYKDKISSRNDIVKYLFEYKTDDFIRKAVHRYNGIKNIEDRL